MILHIFAYKLYTVGFVDFIRKMYGTDNHFFIIYGDCPNEAFRVQDAENIKFINELKEINKDSCIRKLLVKDAEKVIIHANNIYVTKLLMHYSCVLKKAYIVFWGFDIYCYRNEVHGFKDRLFRAIQIHQIKNAKALCFLADKDREILNILIGRTNGKQYKAVYMSSTDNSEVLDIADFKKAVHPCKIIVGNSASRSNNHIVALDILSKYKDKDILIYSPLSYGDPDYANEVASYGKSIFGNKFIPLFELMPLKKYWTFLNQCSVGVFNNDRQQAMGNINLLLGFGAKVYIRSDTSMWNKYNREGFSIFDVKDISALSFEEFAFINPEVQKKNNSLYEDSISLEKQKKIWDEVFFS